MRSIYMSYSEMAKEKARFIRELRALRRYAEYTAWHNRADLTDIIQMKLSVNRTIPGRRLG